MQRYRKDTDLIITITHFSYFNPYLNNSKGKEAEFESSKILNTFLKVFLSGKFLIIEMLVLGKAFSGN